MRLKDSILILGFDRGISASNLETEWRSLRERRLRRTEWKRRGSKGRRRKSERERGAGRERRACEKRGEAREGREERREGVMWER